MILFNHICKCEEQLEALLAKSALILTTIVDNEVVISFSCFESSTQRLVIRC